MELMLERDLQVSELKARATFSQISNYLLVLGEKKVKRGGRKGKKNLTISSLGICFDRGSCS